MRARITVSLIALALVATSLNAATPGKADGKLVVGRETRHLTQAYVIEKDKLLRIVLATQPLDDANLYDDDALQSAVADGSVSAVVVHLDENSKVDSTFFFDAKLPAGIEVRQVGTFKAKKSTDSALSGHLTMEDIGNSFTYDATFEAPILMQLQKVEPLAADASPADHALWRLKQMEIPYDEGHFRSAVMDGNADAVELFLTAGMPVETENALSEAIEMRKPEVVKVLLRHGANANAKDDYGESLVMKSVSNHNMDVLSQLIAAGADVSTPNQYRVTPLAVAAEQGHLDSLNALLAAGAKINARDTAGGTALSVAILRGYKDIVAALLAAGADVQRDKEDLLKLAADKPEIKPMIEKAIKETSKKKK